MDEIAQAKPAANSGDSAQRKLAKLKKKVADINAPGKWRNVLPIHPAADKIPVANNDEKRALAGDLARNGLKVPVVLVRVAGGTPQLLDGRHRLDLMEGTGIEVVSADGAVMVLHEIVDVADDAEAERLSLSLNAHRRHLPLAERRKLLRAQIAATPEKSDRQIGAIVGFSHPTVAAERKKLETSGDVEKLTTSTDAAGRKQPRKRKPPPEKRGNGEPVGASDIKETVEKAKRRHHKRHPQRKGGRKASTETTAEPGARAPQTIKPRGASDRVLQALALVGEMGPAERRRFLELLMQSYSFSATDVEVSRNGGEWAAQSVEQKAEHTERPDDGLDIPDFLRRAS